MAAIQGITCTAIARTLGINQSGLRRKWVGEVPWKTTDLETIAGILNVSPWVLCQPRYDETPAFASEGTVGLVAGRGFEPPTSGL